MKVQLVLLLLLGSFLSHGQVNLVPNPSFEDTVYCPCVTSNCMAMLSDWSAYSYTPEYYNACNPPSPSNGVPSNYFGFQEAATGGAYCGLYSYADSSSFNDFRETIGTQLISNLIIGQKYYMSMKVSFTPADTTIYKECASNNLGMLLTTSPYDALTNPVPINNYSHLRTNNIIDDSTNWTLIFGSFVADSSYQYVVVGNFYVDDSTGLSPNDTACVSYYYVDDICVSTDSVTCYDFTNSINEVINNVIVNMFPNPATDFINISTSGMNGTKRITIYSSIGNIIQSIESTNDKIKINTSNWAEGVYFLSVSVDDSINNQKFIISKNL